MITAKEIGSGHCQMCLPPEEREKGKSICWEVEISTTGSRYILCQRCKEVILDKILEVMERMRKNRS